MDGKIQRRRRRCVEGVALGHAPFAVFLSRHLRALRRILVVVLLTEAPFRCVDDVGRELYQGTAGVLLLRLLCIPRFLNSILHPLPRSRQVWPVSLGQRYERAMDVTGRAVNLASNDLARFDFATVVLPYLLFGPLEAILVFVAVSYILGIVPAIAGMSSLLIIIPIQVHLCQTLSPVHGRL